MTENAKHEEIAMAKDELKRQEKSDHRKENAKSIDKSKEPERNAETPT